MLQDKITDIIFKDLVLDERLYCGDLWFGFYHKNDDGLVFGHKSSSDDDVWYYGEEFDRYQVFFNIEKYDFREILRNYVWKKHNISIGYIF